MWTDVIHLRDFYSTSLGKVAQRVISRQLQVMWPDHSGQIVLGIGYSNPYLKLFYSNAERTLSAMPAAQGVLQWPSDNLSLTTLVDEIELPFPDLSIDRVLLIHALECTENVHPLLREIWRDSNKPRARYRASRKSEGYSTSPPSWGSLTKNRPGPSPLENQMLAFPQRGGKARRKSPPSVH